MDKIRSSLSRKLLIKLEGRFDQKNGRKEGLHLTTAFLGCRRISNFHFSFDCEVCLPRKTRSFPCPCLAFCGWATVWITWFSRTGEQQLTTTSSQMRFVNTFCREAHEQKERSLLRGEVTIHSESKMQPQMRSWANRYRHQYFRGGPRSKLVVTNSSRQTRDQLEHQTRARKAHRSICQRSASTCGTETISTLKSSRVVTLFQI